MNMLEYLPHGLCLKWDMITISLHMISDFMTGVAYFSIPLLLIKLFKEQKHVPRRNLLIWFTLFIVFCGMTHFMSLYNMFIPEYYSSGFVKLCTAIVSIISAIILYKKLPEMTCLQLLGIKKDNILGEVKSMENALHEWLIKNETKSLIGF